MAATKQNQGSTRRAIARRNGSYGGQARAARHPAAQLSEWSSRGGKTVLKKYGTEYFKQIRRHRKSYPRPSITVGQTSPRVIAGRANGRLGGLARARKHDSADLTLWARMGGTATRDRHGADFYSKIRKYRTHYGKGYLTRKTKERLKSQIQSAIEQANRKFS